MSIIYIVDIIAMKYRTLLFDALRLHFDERLSRLNVGWRLGIPKSTICELFVRSKNWPLSDSMTPPISSRHCSILRVSR